MWIYIVTFLAGTIIGAMVGASVSLAFYAILRASDEPDDEFLYSIPPERLASISEDW